MHKPVIGITLDWEKEGSFSGRPHYALRTHYFDAIANAGGVPIALPYCKDVHQDYIAMIDGLIVPGGEIAKPLGWYEKGTTKLPYKESPRLESDIAFIQAALDNNIPYLGICEGMQVLAGMLGCTLTTDIQKFHNSPFSHHQQPHAESRVHAVTAKENTKLAKIIGTGSFATNSVHREGVIRVSNKVAINAVAEDGVIEGIEVKNHPFAIGLEWHPEYLHQDNGPDFAIFKAFIGACGK